MLILTLLFSTFTFTFIMLIVLIPRSSYSIGRRYGPSPLVVILKSSDIVTLNSTRNMPPRLLSCNRVMFASMLSSLSSKLLASDSDTLPPAPATPYLACVSNRIKMGVRSQYIVLEAEFGRPKIFNCRRSGKYTNLYIGVSERSRTKQ